MLPKSDLAVQQTHLRFVGQSKCLGPALGVIKGLLNKCLWFAEALGVTKFKTPIAMDSVTICCAT